MGKQILSVGIIGGGPAGLMSAILLARQGHDVSLIERGTWPLDKVCGEGIMPMGVALLRKHGLLDRIDPNWARAFHGIRYVDSDGRQAEGQFRGHPGLAVRRLALSQALHGAALDESRIRLLPSTDLISFEEHSNQVCISVRDLNSGEQHRLRAFDYLIGADGLKSKLRRLANLDGRVPGCQPRRMGARAHYRLQPWDDKVQVWWKDGIEAYVTPTSSDCVELSFGWDQEQVRPKHSASSGSLEEGLLGYFPELRRRVQGVDKLSSLRSWGPLAHCAKTPLQGRIALIGDAGLFYDQITGEGLSLAFAQAQMLADSIEGWHAPLGRRRFLTSMRGLAKHYIKITDVAMFFTRHPGVRKHMIRLLSKSPALFAHLLHANMGDVSLLRLPIRRVLHDLLGAASAPNEAFYSIPLIGMPQHADPMARALRVLASS